MRHEKHHFEDFRHSLCLKRQFCEKLSSILRKTFQSQTILNKY